MPCTSRSCRCSRHSSAVMERPVKIWATSRAEETSAASPETNAALVCAHNGVIIHAWDIGEECCEGISYRMPIRLLLREDRRRVDFDGFPQCQVVDYGVSVPIE